MNIKLTASDGVVSDRNWLSAAIGSAWKLAKIGMQASAGGESALGRELQVLTAPHLALLRHKRSKFFEQQQSSGRARWRSELHQFVSRVVLPQLEEDPALSGIGSEQLAAMVDEMIACEEERSATLEWSALPSTSRFEDTTWAV